MSNVNVYREQGGDKLVIGSGGALEIQTGATVTGLPQAALVANAAGDAPTAAEFNALLTALKDAGLMAPS